MRILIYTIEWFALMGQLYSLILNVFTQRAPANAAEKLYLNFGTVAYICSLLTVVIFAMLYNNSFTFLKKKSVNIIFLVVVLMGCYIHLWQLFIQHFFILTSCVLLLFDFYIICKVLSTLFTRALPEPQNESGSKKKLP